MKTPAELSFHDQVRQLRIIFFALLALQAVFFLVAWLMQGLTDIGEGSRKLFGYLIPVILFISIFASRSLYRYIVNKSKASSFADKLKNYRIAVMLALTLLESANLLSIIALFLTGEYIYAAASVIMFLLFILNSPSEERFRADLELTSEELNLTE